MTFIGQLWVLVAREALMGTENRLALESPLSAGGEEDGSDVDAGWVKLLVFKQKTSWSFLASVKYFFFSF